MEHKRVLDIPCAPNFRDLGGYETVGGGMVKWGLVYRSDDLSDLPAAGRKAGADLAIRTVVDFRDHAEAGMNPDRLPATVKKQVGIPIEAGRLMGVFADGRLNRRKSMGVMVSVYRALVSDYQDSFRQLFALLADGENLPLLFHCTAGKDRTGVAAALFLSALGVDRSVVREDYLLSRECLKNKYVFGVDYDEVYEPLYSVFPEFLDAAFEVIDSQFGGVETYLRERLGVEAEALRKIYVE